MQVTRKAARRSHLGTRTAMSADGACRSRWVAAVGAWHHGRRPGAGRRPPLAPTRRQALVHSNLRRSPRSASPASEQYIATPGKRHKWRRHLRDSASFGHQFSWETKTRQCCGGCSCTDCGVCLQGCFCPCILYADNKALLEGRDDW